MVNKAVWYCHLCLVTCVLCLGNVCATAQPFRSKPVRLIIPQTAGSATDTVARVISVRLAERLGLPVVPDNRPGASGIIGADAVAKAPPDGHTILIVSATHTVNPSLHRKLPYDPIRDFSPVTLATSQLYILTVNPSLPAKSVKDFVALAKARPGQMDCAVPAIGSLGHLAFELLGTMTGTRMTIVPYKGATPAVTDLMGGHVSAMFNTLVTALPQVKAGRLRGLAVTGTQRSALFPGVPTVAESGVPGFEVSGWYGILAPANTPAAIVTRLNTEFIGILRLPEVRERLSADGSEAVGSTPQQFADRMRTEVVKWGKVVKAAGIPAE